MQLLWSFGSNTHPKLNDVNPLEAWPGGSLPTHWSGTLVSEKTCGNSSSSLSIMNSDLEEEVHCSEEGKKGLLKARESSRA